jgi:hypothetical protein
VILKGGSNNPPILSPPFLIQIMAIFSRCCNIQTQEEYWAPHDAATHTAQTFAGMDCGNDAAFFAKNCSETYAGDVKPVTID